MRTIKIFLIISLLISGCDKSVHTEKHNVARTIEHFTIADLEKLGCKIEATPKILSFDMPLVGHVDGYRVESDSACATKLVSTINPYDNSTVGIEEGAWAGKKVSAMNVAENRGYDLSSQDGNIGERSEIELFTKNGRQAGFQYSVLANGYLHSVLIESDSIEPNEAFESILKEKL